jgi:hypothetical protein
MNVEEMRHFLKKVPPQVGLVIGDATTQELSDIQAIRVYHEPGKMPILIFVHKIPTEELKKMIETKKAEEKVKIDINKVKPLMGPRAAQTADPVDVEVLSCVICGFTVTTEEELAEHLKTHEEAKDDNRKEV